MSKDKVLFNLKNAHYAKHKVTGEDGTITFDTPVAIPGSVSLSLDAEGEVTKFYADGIVYYVCQSNNGYSGDFEVAMFPEQKNAAEQVEQGKNTTIEAVKSIIDSAKEASDASATSVAARDVAKAAQNVATQQATQAAQSKDAADKLMQQAKTYADEAAGYAGAAKYSFGYTSDGRFAFFVNDESEV